MDKMYLNNILLILKSNLEVYNHGTIESSNEDIRETIKYGLDTTLELQNKVFNKMTEYGYYQINNIKPNIIKQTLNKIAQEK